MYMTRMANKIPRIPRLQKIKTRAQCNMRDDLPHRSTVCFSFLESCGGTSLRSEVPLAPRLENDELRVPAVTVLNVQKEGER